MQGNPAFAHDTAGNVMTRQRSCECGRKFTQVLLSERFYNIIAKRGQRALDMFNRQIPGGYVPVHCPSCERRDLGRQARLDESRVEYQQPFGEAAD